MLKTKSENRKEPTDVISQICLDMDGVLCDFITPAAKLFGHELVDVLSRWQRGIYDICHALEISENELWSRIDRHGFRYWADLPPYPWHKELLKGCQQLAETIVLTSPSAKPASSAGKIAWLQRHYGGQFRDYLIGPRKHFCARPGAVLIDDSDENCQRFIADKTGRPTGGSAIVFPRHWNSQHEHQQDPLAYVARQLASLASTITPKTEAA